MKTMIAISIAFIVFGYAQAGLGQPGMAVFMAGVSAVFLVLARAFDIHGIRAH